MSESVLVVDDDKAIVGYVESIFCDRGLKIFAAYNGADAAGILARERIAVLITDNHMPGMSGLELLARTKEISPDTVKVMMSAYADLSTTLIAINQGEVFRFLVKPWKREEMLHTVRDAIRHYRALQAPPRSDDKILRSLAQAIELKDPYTKGHCERVARYAVAIAEALGLPPETVREITYGSWLHDCGKIGIPEQILNVRRPLHPEEFDVVRNHSSWGTDVARQAEFSDTVLNIILYHHEQYAGNGYPTGISGSEIPLEARIVAVADVFDALLTDRPYRSGYPWEQALEIIASMRGTELNPEIVDVFFANLERMRPPEEQSG